MRWWCERRVVREAVRWARVSVDARTECVRRDALRVIIDMAVRGKTTVRTARRVDSRRTSGGDDRR